MYQNTANVVLEILLIVGEIKLNFKNTQNKQTDDIIIKGLL